MASTTIPGGIEFKFDTSALMQFAAAWRAFPEESGKWAAKLVNDMAFVFKNRFPFVIDSPYTIRDDVFIKRSIAIDKAKPRSKMADIQATVGTWRGTGFENFSGFTEELTGQPDQFHKHQRVILPAGRGSSMAGKSKGWARIKPNQRIPTIIDPALQNLPENQRFAAMIAMMRSGRLPKSPSNTFILEGGKYKRGLYRFRGGALPKSRFFQKYKLEMIQSFKDKPVMPPKWNWQELVMNEVKKKFSPGYIFENYITKALLGIMPEKKPCPKK